MDRITDKDLSRVVARINNLMGTPIESWKLSDVPLCGTSYVANVGNYHIDSAYGGVSLCQMVNENGGTRDVLRTGHVSKRELRNLMFAYIEGIEDGRKLAARKEEAKT